MQVVGDSANHVWLNVESPDFWTHGLLLHAMVILDARSSHNI